MPPLSLRLKLDERGAILLVAVFFAVFAVAILYSLIATAEAVTFREALQDRADRVALSASILHARAMNLIVLINLVMAALLAILVALKLAELLAIVGMIIAAGLAWITAGATLAAIPPLKVVQTNMSESYQSFKGPIYSALEALHETAGAIRAITPVAATAAFGSDKGAAMPTRLTLPVEDDRFEALCGKSGEIAAKLAFLPLARTVPALDELDGPLSSASGDMTEALSEWFCGDGSSGPPTYSTTVKKSYPMTPDDEECQRSGQSTSTSQRLSEDLCTRSAEHQQAAKPDADTGGCLERQDCSATGPYETRVALARDQCDPTRKPAPFIYYFQKRHGTVEYEWTGEVWVRHEPSFDEPQRVEHSLPPCGPRSVFPTVAEGYDRVVREGTDVSEIRPVCSTDHPPTLLLRETLRKGDRFKIEFDEVTHILGCVTEEKETVNVADADPGGHGKGPKKVEERLELGDEAFLIRSFVREDLGKLESRRLVRLSLWGEADPENPLSALRQFSDIAFAQAEYFYEGDETREAWMWNMKWRARLVRFRLPADSLSLEGLQRVCAPHCGALSALTELGALIAH